MRRAPRLFAAVLSAVMMLIGLVALPAEAGTWRPCCGESLSFIKTRVSPATMPMIVSPGQVIVISGNLTAQGGAPVGSYSSVHTVISIAADGMSYEVINATVYKLTRGTISTSGTENWALNGAPQPSAVQTVAITGGTGVFRRAAGTAHSNYNYANTGGTSVLITFTNRR